MKDLILASQSPRRKELLSLYTTDFTVCVSDFDEDAVTADTPARLVEQLARGKCLAVAKEHPGAVVLGCDTVEDVNGEVFGKPHSPDDARRMLRALSGATHYVHTGVCVSDGTRTESFVDTCKVTFFPLSEEEIERYAATEEPYDKAGAYAIQGRAAVWLEAIEPQVNVFSSVLSSFSVFFIFLCVPPHKLSELFKQESFIMSFLSKDVGVDLGTANTLVYMKGKGIIMREPSVVAVDTKTDEVRCVGAEAKAVIGRTPGSIVAVPVPRSTPTSFDKKLIMKLSFVFLVYSKTHSSPNSTGFDRLSQNNTFLL